MERIEYISESPSDTLRIGEEVAKLARCGDLFLLFGELGAGKTQFVKGMAKALGVKDWQYVVSPSFTIMNIYEGSDITLCHVDLYRIEDADELELEMEEFLETGIVAVEWPEKKNWQKDAIRIIIHILDENKRKIEVIKP